MTQARGLPPLASYFDQQGILCSNTLIGSSHHDLRRFVLVQVSCFVYYYNVYFLLWYVVCFLLSVSWCLVLEWECMISDVIISSLASAEATSRLCSSMVVCRKTHIRAGGYPRMVIASDVDVETATRSRSERIVGLRSSSSTSSLSWKPPWEARQETRGVLTGVGYDTDAMERFFVHRPERTWARCTQVL